MNGTMGPNDAGDAGHSAGMSRGRIAKAWLVAVHVWAAALLVPVSSALAAGPTVTIDPNPMMGYTTAHVSGEIDPGSEEMSFYAESRLKGSTGGWTEDFIEFIPANSGPVPVTADITGLTVGTEYEFRLDAYNPTALETFSPLPNPVAATKAPGAPSVTIEGPVGSVTSDSAVFSGHVNPEAPEPAPASAEVEAAFAVNWHFECTPACPGASGPNIPAGNTAQPVQAEATGLMPGTEYQVRLVGENAGGETTKAVSAPVHFRTAPIAPVIVEPATLLVSGSGAKLGATITPGGAATIYRVEYGTTASYGSITEPVSVGSGAEGIEIAPMLAGLTPGTSYHWRLVASNEIETVFGPDLAFTTFGAEPLGGLPDGRAYEQVTPTDKNGGIPEPGYEPNQTAAAVVGGGVTFRAESSIPGAEGAQEIGEFVASRAADGSGWSSQGLYPPASAGPYGAFLGWSEDLSRSWSEASVARGANFRLYERITATGQTKLVSSAGEAAFGGVFGGGFQLVAAPGNGVEAAFEAERPAAPLGQPEKEPFLLESITQTVTAAAVQNDGNRFAGGAVAGRIIETEPILGSLVYKEEPPNALPLLNDGRDLIFTSASGGVYLRRNIDAPQSPIGAGEVCLDAADACTIALSASQRTTPDPNGPRIAYFASAARNAAKIYFTSTEALTNDANTGPSDAGADLYGFEPGSGDLADLTPDPGDPNGAEVSEVVGASNDGSTLYFVGAQVLATNIGADGTHAGPKGNCPLREPSASQISNCNLYVWHTDGSIAEGHIDYVADLQSLGLEDIKATVRVSADGNVLLFGSRRDVGGVQNAGATEYYRFDRRQNLADCVTCAPTGARPIGGAALHEVYPSGGQGAASHPFLTSQPRNLSVNGSRVFFYTPDALVSSDTNGTNGCPAEHIEFDEHEYFSCLDVYEWEAPAEGSCSEASPSFSSRDGGCLFLISTGKSSEPSFFADASANGDDVYFFTGQSLVAQDRDTLQDIYDARVGGGIASQNAALPLHCESAEACSGETVQVPSATAPSTSTLVGPGNEAHHKKKHHKKKHHKKKHHKKKHHKKKHHKKSGPTSDRHDGMKAGGK